VTRADAAEKIEAHLRRGRELREALRNQTIRSFNELDEAQMAMWRWSERTQSLLEGLFDNRSVADSTRMIPIGGISERDPLPQGIAWVYKEWGDHLNAVQSVLERLDTYQELPMETTPMAASPIRKSASQAVFIVHGHNDGAKDAVARLLERLGLKYTILHEQANRGQTIIEKFERHAEAAFAVVLLTPDDVGASKDKQDHLQPRARQNVIFELGFFYAKLGRENVCALYKDIEPPSDISGILYTPMDLHGQWRYKLAQELDAAGLEVDMNRLKGM
jgi:predicted nucleotide-binding protein